MGLPGLGAEDKAQANGDQGNASEAPAIAHRDIMGWLSSFFRDGRVIFGSMGIGAVGLLFSIRRVLEKWREDAEVKPVQPKTQYITQDTEDSLATATLDILLGHYNYAIKETAAKIVCERAANDGSITEMLLWGITRPDYDERLRNLRALRILMELGRIFNRPLPCSGVAADVCRLENPPMIHTWKAYSALVRSLELSIDPEQETLNDETWDEYPLRDAAEKHALELIHQLVSQYGPEKLIKAKFVEKWLAKQNWGKTEDERQINLTKYLQHKRNYIREIVANIQITRSGREILEKTGLMALGCEVDQETEDHDHVMVSDRLNLLLSMNPDRNRDSALDLARTLQSIEHRLRQRNREAIVLNDGTHPVNRDDIIHRDLGPSA